MHDVVQRCCTLGSRISLELQPLARCNIEPLSCCSCNTRNTIRSAKLTCLARLAQVDECVISFHDIDPSKHPDEDTHDLCQANGAIVWKLVQDEPALQGTLSRLWMRSMVKHQQSYGCKKLSWLTCKKPFQTQNAQPDSMTERGAGLPLCIMRGNAIER